jgi:deoxyribonuclease-4
MSLVDNLKKNRIGAHLSIKGSMLNLFKEAETLNINTFACFTGPNLRYTLTTSFREEIICQFKEKIKEKNYQIFSHACYLINIANQQNQSSYSKSIDAIKAELDRCSLLGIMGAVIHPGSNKNRKDGLAIIIETINELFETYTNTAILLLESSAGQGSTLPVTIDDMSLIYNELTPKAKLKTKAVIDTCHVHAAGYDLSTKASVEKFLGEYDRIIGLDKVALIHLNDSKRECGSRIDRHENIGKGTIGLEGFSAFINDNRIKLIPKILETPVESYLDWRVDLDCLDRLLEQF